MTLDRILGADEFVGVRRYRLNLDQGDQIIDRRPVDTLVTVVTFRGHREVGRTIGKTDPDFLRAFIRRAMTDS